MAEAVLTIVEMLEFTDKNTGRKYPWYDEAGKMHDRTDTFCKFKCAGGKTWNYSFSQKYQGRNITAYFQPEKHLHVEYRLVPITEGPGAGKESRYIDTATAAAPSEPDTFVKQRQDFSRVETSVSKQLAKPAEFRTPEQIVRNYVLGSVCTLRRGTTTSIDEILADAALAAAWVSSGESDPGVLAAEACFDGEIEEEDANIPF